MTDEETREEMRAKLRKAMDDIVANGFPVPDTTESWEYRGVAVYRSSTGGWVAELPSVKIHTSSEDSMQSSIDWHIDNDAS